MLNEFDTVKDQDPDYYDADQVQQNFGGQFQFVRQEADDGIYADMLIFPYSDRDTNENRPDDQEAGQLLGPDRGMAEAIPGNYVSENEQ